MSVAPSPELRGHHVLMALAGFFGLMLIANITFIYLALSTFDGTESNAYQNGLNYNARIEAAKAQDALGWSHRAALGTDGTVTLAMTGRDGTPILSLAVEGEIGRPAAQRFSQPLAFEEIAAGVYHAHTADLEAGNWIVTLTVRPARPQGGEPAYQLRERLWLQPKP